mgnify:CR=1 FL=1
MIRIILSFLSIVIVMLIFNYILFQNSVSGMYKQMKDYNRLVAKNVIQSFDNAFKEVDNIFHTVDILKTSQPDIYDWNSHQNLNMFAMFKLTKGLSGTKSNSPDYIEQIIIYFKNSDLAITTDGTIAMDDLFGRKYKSAEHPTSYWRSFSHSIHPVKIMPASYYTDTITFDRRKRLIAVLASNMISSGDATTLVLVDEAKLLNYVGYSNVFGGASLIVMDSNQNTILNIGETHILDQLQGYSMSDDESYFQDESYEYYVEKSDYNGFTYTHILPVSYGSVFTMVRNNQLILLFNVLAGIGGAIALSLYIYNPTRKILGLFGLSR